jgi:tRNA(Ile)-lysidine synthetase-like protein
VSELLDCVEQSIRTRRLFRLGQGILVAVSGGADSMVLLHLLHHLAPRHGWQVTAAHFNHQLRGRSSAADERLVRRTARQLRVPLVVGQADVRKFARGRRLSLEMAARKLRHEFLARTARRLRMPSVVLAHHADDQVELFFLRLLRGSGGEGLAGMKWRSPSPSGRDIELVRPLLDQPKAVLAEYAAEHRIRYREDASNEVLDFQRNRIRHELLPLLRRKYQPALDRIIPRVMDIVGADAEFAAQAAREWIGSGEGPKSEGRRPKEIRSAKPERAGPSLRRLLRGQGGGRGGLAFEKLPVAVQRRCVQLQLVRQGIVPDYELVEQLRITANRPVAISRTQAAGEARAGGAGEARMPYASRGVDRERGAGPSEVLYGSEVQGRYGPLFPALSPSEEERGNRRQVFGKSRFRGSALRPDAALSDHEPPRTCPSASPLPASWGKGGRRPGEGRFMEREAQGTGGTPVLLYAIRDRLGLVHVQSAEPKEFKIGSAEVDLGGGAGEVEFGGARIWWRIGSKKAVRQPNPGVRGECFDADKVGSPVLLRHWQPGDRFQPIGMTIPVKLQDFFTNQKVPRDQRRQLILGVTAKGEVFWVEGMRISERFKLTRPTIRGLQWRWKRL